MLLFDQIPSGLVSQITVFDTNRPDMDAEALGGQIELTPRSAFDSDKPILQGRLGSGYEPLRPRYAIINGEIIGGFRFGFGPGGNPLVSSYSSPAGSSVALMEARRTKKGSIRKTQAAVKVSPVTGPLAFSASSATTRITVESMISNRALPTAKSQLVPTRS